jgi:glycosyltransferase involved in cell wall biosynthesis
MTRDAQRETARPDRRLRARGGARLVVMSQVYGTILLEYAASFAERFGPTVLHTGSAFDRDRRDLTVVEAPKYDNSSVCTRALTWAKYLLHALWVGLTTPGRPVLLLSTNPPFLPWVALICRKLRGFRYVVQVLDVYPDVLVQRGVLGARHPLVRLWRYVNRLAYRNAEAVITLGPVMVDRVAAQVPETEVLEIPSWVDPEAYRPIPKEQNPFAAEHGQRGKLTVIYSGNFGLTHDLGGLFEAARELQSQEDISFLMIGGGARRREVVAVAEELPNVLALPYQPEEVLPYSMACGDVGVVTLGAEASGISMPSKSYYLMASGNALLALCTGDNDLRRLVEEHRCGLVVDPHNAAGIASAIRRFQSDGEFLAECRRNARLAVERAFGKDGCTARYDRLLRDIQSRAARGLA